MIRPNKHQYGGGDHESNGRRQSRPADRFSARLLRVVDDGPPEGDEWRTPPEGWEHLRDFLDHANDLIHVTDAHSHFLYVNRKWMDTLGYTREEALALTWARITPPDEREYWEQAFRRAVAGEEIDDLETVLVAKDGTPVPVSVNLNCRFEGGRAITTRVIARDISKRKAFEEQLERQAFRDPLTGLPNRALFTDRLQFALVRGARSREPVAVLFMDLDRFKVINDSLGHEVGDQLLVAVAARLRRCLRPHDTLARLGGDEFVILLEEFGDVPDAVRVAERVIEALGDPFSIGGQTVYIASSVGIAVGSPGAADPAGLLRNADLAMYRAKDLGKARYELFDDELAARARARLEIENDLRRAVERGEFLLEYQPKVELSTGRITCIEALVRWRHPLRGIVPPTEFIPIAEETGLILPICRWVLGEACARAREWQDAYPDDDRSIAVNISARQFEHPHLIEELASTLDHAGLEPRHLLIEITESIIMEDGQNVAEKLHRLEALGVELAIDDFGTGYSSLSYLKRLPVGTLKIDKSFVAGLGKDEKDRAIVETIITLAHALELRVTAEGIETEEQLAEIRALGCDVAQGYLFSRPVPAPAIPGLLGRSVGRVALVPPFHAAELGATG